MNVTDPALYPLQHHVNRIDHAQPGVLLHERRRQYVLKAARAEAIDVAMLAASVSCPVEKCLGDHGRHQRMMRAQVPRALVSLGGEVRTVVHGVWTAGVNAGSSA